MAESFGAVLRSHMKKHGLTMRAYAQALGYPNGHSYVMRVVNNKLAPPLKQLDRWATPLQLTEDERRLFDFLAAIAHAPPPVRAWFAAYDKPLLSPPRRRASARQPAT